MMHVAEPRFQNKLLRAVSAALGVKRRSLRHRGDYDIQLGADDVGEWLRATFKRASGPVVVIELIDSGFANVYVQSARKPDRNKILYRREGLRLVGNGSRVFDAIVSSFDCADYSESSHASLDAVWRKCSINSLHG